MKAIVHALIVLVLLGGAAFSQNTAPPQSPAQNAISIVKPAAGEALRQNFAVVSWSLTNPGATAAGAPNYQVRIDSQDPITTSQTEYTFTGLTPGAHKVTVQLVDANGTPIPSGRAEVQFNILRQTVRKYGPQAIAAALRLDPASDIHVRNAAEPAAVPNAGGTLPLLSVIGFGVLLGGIASAMKSRRQTSSQVTGRAAGTPFSLPIGSHGTLSVPRIFASR